MTLFADRLDERLGGCEADRIKTKMIQPSSRLRAASSCNSLSV